MPVYTTQAVEQIRYILENSCARAFVSGKKIFSHAKAALKASSNWKNRLFLDDEAVPAPEDKYLTLAAWKNAARSFHKSTTKLSTGFSELDAQDLATLSTLQARPASRRRQAHARKFYFQDRRRLERLADSQRRPLARRFAFTHIFERCVFYVLCANGVAIHSYCASF